MCTRALETAPNVRFGGGKMLLFFAMCIVPPRNLVRCIPKNNHRPAEREPQNRGRAQQCCIVLKTQRTCSRTLLYCSVHRRSVPEDLWALPTHLDGSLVCQGVLWPIYLRSAEAYGGTCIYPLLASLRKTTIAEGPVLV